jgi:hypothetical protein
MHAVQVKGGRYVRLLMGCDSFMMSIGRTYMQGTYGFINIRLQD